MEFRTVAVFGAGGQVGKVITHALVNCKKQDFQVIAVVSPKSYFEAVGELHRVVIKRLDLHTASDKELAAVLTGVDVVLSALGASALDYQAKIQDAAAIAGVRRFYPSEFGMYQVAWLPDGPYLHPTWTQKMRCTEGAMKHSAIRNGKMSYTVIGCGEFYDAPREPILCPWLVGGASEYVVQAVGNGDAKMDYCSLWDVAAFLVATLCEPELSKNCVLGFRSDYISYNEITALLAKHSGKPARTNIIPVSQMQRVLRNPESAPVQYSHGSSFPVDFWMLLRYVQGQGEFWRPPGQLHNDLFPEVRPVSFDAYFSRLFRPESKL